MSLLAILASVRARFADDRRGATAIEYALVAGLVSIAIVGTAGDVGSVLQNIFDGVEAGFENE